MGEGNYLNFDKTQVNQFLYFTNAIRLLFNILGVTNYIYNRVFLTC